MADLHSCPLRAPQHEFTEEHGQPARIPARSTPWEDEVAPVPPAPGPAFCHTGGRYRSPPSLHPPAGSRLRAVRSPQCDRCGRRCSRTCQNRKPLEATTEPATGIQRLHERCRASWESLLWKYEPGSAGTECLTKSRYGRWPNPALVSESGKGERNASWEPRKSFPVRVVGPSHAESKVLGARWLTTGGAANMLLASPPKGAPGTYAR